MRKLLESQEATLDQNQELTEENIESKADITGNKLIKESVQHGTINVPGGDLYSLVFGNDLELTLIQLMFS